MRRLNTRWYRKLLHQLTWGELSALYERTRPEYPSLARVIAEELNGRFATETAELPRRDEFVWAHSEQKQPEHHWW